MTWFRVEAALRDHKVIGVIAEALGVRPAEAAGLYVLTLAGFAEHEPSGRPALVTNTDLEGWARWHGRRGKYAELFRERLVEQRPDELDEPGTIKGWWRQKKLLERQERDRQRPGEGTRKARDRPVGANGVPSGGNDDDDADDDGNGYEEQSSSAVAREAVATGTGGISIGRTDYTRRCTVACNRGLRENPKVNGFRELVSSNQVTETEPWAEAGIPAEFAEQIVYERALSYVPRGSNRQPTTLHYFDKPLREAWEREQGRGLEGGFQPKQRAADAQAEEELDIYERTARRLEAQGNNHAS